MRRTTYFYFAFVALMSCAAARAADETGPPASSEETADAGAATGRNPDAAGTSENEDAASDGDLTRNLSRKQIVVLNENIPAIQKCFEVRLLENPELAGKLTFGWTIVQDGSVEDVELLYDGVGDPELVGCVGDIIRQMSFPAPAGDGTQRMKYPFIFRVAR